jgi:hypothetical protein
MIGSRALLFPSPATGGIMVENSGFGFLRDAHRADFSRSDDGRRNELLTRAARELVENWGEGETEDEYAPQRSMLVPIKSPGERHDWTPLAELKKIIRSLTYGEMMEACGALTGEPDYKAPSNPYELAAMLHKYACKGEEP